MGFLLDWIDGGFDYAIMVREGEKMIERVGRIPIGTLTDGESEKKDGGNHMSNDAKMAKFEIFLEEILEALRSCEDSCFKSCFKSPEYTWTGLALIYDYNKLNDYGKKIMNIDGDIHVMVTSGNLDIMKKKLLNYEDEVFKVNKAKEFAELFGMEIDVFKVRRRERYLTFMFWALMILAVDDMDKEEHLASVCDLAKIWKIADEIMLDIVQIIRIVYYREEGIKLQTSLVKGYFKQLLKHYGYDYDDAGERGTYLTDVLSYMGEQ
ncbi:MAG: hypothetical protein NC313_17220 [Butyrivibrio sp.]|nr:hypothetical protein [Butyrivibrio sp.]